VDLPQAVRLVVSPTTKVPSQEGVVEVLMGPVVEAAASVAAAVPTGATTAATARLEDSHLVAGVLAAALVVELASEGRHRHRLAMASVAVSADLPRLLEVALVGPQVAVAVAVAGLVGMDRALPALVRQATNLEPQLLVAALPLVAALVGLAAVSVQAVAFHRLGDCASPFG